MKTEAKQYSRRNFVMGVWQQFQRIRMPKSDLIEAHARCAMGRHSATLHGVKWDKKNKTSIKDEKSNGNQNEEPKCASVNTGSGVASTYIVPVRVKKKDSINEVQTYALLDSCSKGTSLLDNLIKVVGTSGRKTSVTIKTTNGAHTSSSMTIEDLQVANINNVEDGWIDLPKTYTKLDLPVDNADITQPPQFKQSKYLDHITNQLNLEDNLPFGLLIGANCVKALEPLEILQSRNECSYAFITRLGWCIVGPVNRARRTQYLATELLLDKQILNKLVLISFKWKRRCTIMQHQIC